MPDPRHGQVQVWDSIKAEMVWKDFPVSEADDLREATREAHAAMKDLGKLMAEFDAKVEEKRHDLTELTYKAFDDEVSKIVKEGLDEYQQTMDEAIEEGQAAVIRRFDRIYDVLMGKDKAHIRRNGVSVEEAILGESESVKQLIAERMKMDPVKGVIP